MKKKITLGEQLNLNANFEAAGVDTSVTYSIPAAQQDTISVDAQGVVTALAEGTATVEIKDAATDRLLRAVVIQVLSATDSEAQTELDSGAASLEIDFIEIPPTNTPVLVSAADAADNYVSVTFSNTLSVTNRNFQIGIRDIGSEASSTSVLGRHEYEVHTFTGAGPHTVSIFSEVLDGTYEVYVQDLVDMSLGYAVVTINTEDLTPPNTTLSGAWSPYTKLITLNWSALDAESGISSLRLDLRSPDGASVLVNNLDVLQDADNTVTAYVEPNGITYVATLVAANPDGKVKTISSLVEVPPAPNQPKLVTGVDNGDNSITISWTNSVFAKTDLYQVGLRPAGVMGNTYSMQGVLNYSPAFAHPDAQTTVGPLSYHMELPNTIESGTYEVYVYDYTSAKFAYATVSYVRHDMTPPVVSVSGSWQNSQFSLSWSATDNESAITAKTLDLRSSDGSVILLNNSSVLANVSNSLTLGHEADEKTYLVTFKGTNETGLQSTASTSIVVPPHYSFPKTLAAVQQLRATDISVSWATDYSVTSRSYQIKLQTVGGGSDINSAYKTISGTGPFTQVISIGAAATGTYQVSVRDVTTNEALTTTFAYAVPPTLMRVNPYMNSNTTRYPYNSYQPPSMVDSLPAGVASVSSYYVNNVAYDAYTAFNAELFGGWVANAATPQWLQYAFETPTQISGYRLTGRATDDSHLEDFQLQGSADGSTWVTLDEKVGQGNLGNLYSQKTFMLASDATYRYYRLLVTKCGQTAFTVNGIRYATLAEMDLLGYR